MGKDRRNKGQAQQWQGQKQGTGDDAATPLGKMREGGHEKLQAETTARRTQASSNGEMGIGGKASDGAGIL
jgi:hypothetical protein